MPFDFFVRYKKIISNGYQAKRLVDDFETAVGRSLAVTRLGMW
ncbi:MAG: hypothetical protein WBM07_00730 [Chitinivibrionales bacterium]